MAEVVEDLEHQVLGNVVVFYATRTGAKYPLPPPPYTPSMAIPWVALLGKYLGQHYDLYHVTHTLTWIVRPTVMFCMELNILTQYPLPFFYFTDLELGLSLNKRRIHFFSYPLRRINIYSYRCTPFPGKYLGEQ